MINIKGQYYSGYFPRSDTKAPSQNQFHRKAHHRNKSVINPQLTVKKQKTQINNLHNLQPIIKINSLSQYTVVKNYHKSVNSFGQGRVHVKNNIQTHHQQIRLLNFDSLRKLLLNSNDKINSKPNNIFLPKKQKRNQKLMKYLINNVKRRINTLQNKNLSQRIQTFQIIHNNQKPTKNQIQKIQIKSPKIRYGKLYEVENKQIKLRNYESQQIMKSVSGWKIIMDKGFLSSKVKKSVRLNKKNNISS